MNNMDELIPHIIRGITQLFVYPVKFLIPIQSMLIGFSWEDPNLAIAILKRIFLFMPVMAMVVGLWCTLFTIYTLIFRGQRLNLLGTLLVLWWDAARAVWLFWAGMGKFLLVAFGACWGLLRLTVGMMIELIRELVELPFVLTGRATASLRTPGVPWIAFLMMVGWAGLEGGIFTYILTPTMTEIMSDLVGSETHTYLMPVLFVMLFFMILGSFACMHVLVEAIEKKDIKAIVQMAIVEGSVMFVEVAFFYRELIDSLTPWIAQQTGWQMGLGQVVFLSSMGWVGIRGMVWFLFGRYGTPTLLALISRQRLSNESSAKSIASGAEVRLDTVFKKLKSEQEWFKDQADELLSAAVLPTFQVIASTLNFCFVLILSKPLFSVPFKELAQIGETKTLLIALFTLKEGRYEKYDKAA